MHHGKGRVFLWSSLPLAFPMPYTNLPTKGFYMSERKYTCCCFKFHKNGQLLSLKHRIFSILGDISDSLADQGVLQSLKTIAENAMSILKWPQTPSQHLFSPLLLPMQRLGKDAKCDAFETVQVLGCKG